MDTAVNNERQLINYLKANICPTARFERSKDKDKQNYHVTVRDVDSALVYDGLRDSGFVLSESTRPHSSAYTGKKLTFKGNVVYIVVRDKNSNGVHYMKRKDVTPDKIGLGGKTYTNTNIFRNDVHQGLLHCTTTENTIALMSILDVIDEQGVFENTHVLVADKSRITSDFGEVASAYSRVKKGQRVYFPKESNYPGIDFFADDIGVSAKGDKGSSRLSTIDFKESIDKLGYSTEEMILKHLCARQIYKAINVAADACAELKYFKRKLGTITQENMENYVDNNTYDTYITDVKNAQWEGIIGIPKKESECRRYWNNGDINPLLFTFCTFLHRFYSQQNIDKISNLVVKLFKDTPIEFEYFDYNIEENKVIVNILPIYQYKVWEINYWGNAAIALNNWPAVKGLE